MEPVNPGLGSGDDNDELVVAFVEYHDPQLCRQVDAELSGRCSRVIIEPPSKPRVNQRAARQSAPHRLSRQRQVSVGHGVSIGV